MPTSTPRKTYFKKVSNTKLQTQRNELTKKKAVTITSSKPTVTKRKKKKGHYHTGVYTSSKCKKEIHYRSGWEQVVCEHLDSDPLVKEFFYEELIIAYRTRPTQIKPKKYITDFFVIYTDGTKKIIEVKADNKVNHIITLKKTAAAKEWCTKNNVVYEIWTSNKIKELLKEQKQKLIQKAKLTSLVPNQQTV